MIKLGSAAFTGAKLKPALRKMDPRTESVLPIMTGALC